MARRRVVSLEGLRANRSAAALVVQPGDLLTARGEAAVLVQVRLGGGKSRLRSTALEQAFVPRGMDYDEERRLLAIAAVSRVILYNVDTGELVAIEGPGDSGGERFGFASDVAFLGDGLLIADLGEVTSGQQPTDGSLWRLELNSNTVERLASKRKFSNPRLIAVDSTGVPLLVDGEAGPFIAPGLDLRYDRVYEIRGSKLARAKVRFRDPGLTASALAIDSDDRLWFGTVTDLGILLPGGLAQPCDFSAPFDFVTGIGFSSAGKAFAIDGSDAVNGTKRMIYLVNDRCRVRRKAGGGRVAGARGLAIVGADSEELATAGS